VVETGQVEGDGAGHCGSEQQARRIVQPVTESRHPRNAVNAPPGRIEQSSNGLTITFRRVPRVIYGVPQSAYGMLQPPVGLSKAAGDALQLTRGLKRTPRRASF
jgi:hypothetical protein